MTPGIRKNTGETGTVLFSALALLAIAAVGLGALLSGSQQELRNNARMLAFRSALPIAEAGIEEGLAHLNVNGFNPANGWFVNPTNGALQKTRSLNTGYFTAQIFSNATPIIRSTGYFPAPLQTNYLARTVQITVREVRYAGIEAITTITGSSDGVLDSFDSSDPAASTSGMYDPAKAKDNCRVATLSSANNKISLGSRKVYGLASTTGGTVALNSKGKVGSKNWILRSDTGGKIEPGRFATDYIGDFPPNGVPFTGGLAPMTNVSLGTNTYVYVFGTGDYEMSKFILKSSEQAIVTGKARLHVTTQFTLTASSRLVLAPGASMEVYVGCPSVSVTGQGFLNLSGAARNFKLFGLPSNTAIKLAGSADFMGIINAPAADVQLGGGSTYYGHVKCASADISGGNAFHADEAVGTLAYLIGSWSEL